MSELSYKELQEQGVFDVPYRAFKYMQSQQVKIDELQARVDKTVSHIEEWYGCVELSNIVDMLKENKDEN